MNALGRTAAERGSTPKAPTTVFVFHAVCRATPVELSAQRSGTARCCGGRTNAKQVSAIYGGGGEWGVGSECFWVWVGLCRLKGES